MLAVADQPMTTTREALSIDLVAMPQSWLHDAVATVNLQDETVDVGHQFFVDLRQVGGDDATEQQPAEAWRWLDGQHQVSERQSACRRMGARMKDFDFGKYLRVGLAHRPDATERVLSAVKLIEQVVDCVSIIGTNDENVVFPTMTDATFDE